MQLGIKTNANSRPFFTVLAAALAVVLTCALAACGTNPKTGSDSGKTVAEPQPYAEIAQLEESVDAVGERAARSNEIARVGFTSARVAVVGDAEDSAAGLCVASLAKALRLPALAAGSDLSETAQGLGVETLLVVPHVEVDQAGGAEIWEPASLAEVSNSFADVDLREVVSDKAGIAELMALADGEVFACGWPEQAGGDGAGGEAAGEEGVAGEAAASSDKLPDGKLVEAPGQSAVAVVADGDVLAAGTLAAGGVAIVGSGAWMEDEQAAAQVLAADPLVMVGAADAVSQARWQVAVRSSGVELPGGGYEVFAGKRYVALYGTPVGPALGVLGEQDGPATIARAAKQAAVYQELSEDTIVPTLEMITTVASGSAGGDGNYSNEWPSETFTPLIEAAGEAGQYVVLDFQPGRSDFLSQVRLYEDLLRYPHVGIALDPEWRLGPDEQPLQRIGHVEIDEVNEVVNWLADFTREHGLPQKMMVLHQFQTQMVRDRDQLDTSRPEVALLIHADGQGSQAQKRATWDALRKNAPEDVRWGWKNFIDEDHPMLTEKQTYQVQPQPHFVSYQ